MKLDENLLALSAAGIHASLHSLRILSNRGMVSPEEIDNSLDGIAETLENASPEFSAMMLEKLNPLFAEIKHSAKKNWQG